MIENSVRKLFKNKTENLKNAWRFKAWMIVNSSKYLVNNGKNLFFKFNIFIVNYSK